MYLAQVLVLRSQTLRSNRPTECLVGSATLFDHQFNAQFCRAHIHTHIYARKYTVTYVCVHKPHTFKLLSPLRKLTRKLLYCLSVHLRNFFPFTIYNFYFLPTPFEMGFFWPAFLLSYTHSLLLLFLFAVF